MTGKRRWSAYVISIVLMSAVEYLANGTEQGMSLSYQAAMIGVSALHFGGVAIDKFKNGKNDGDGK